MTNDVENALGLQIANPKGLGFGVFAILGWMYSMVWAGWFPQEVFGSGTALDAAVLATYALLIAGLASFLRGETWHAVFFTFWAAYAWSAQAQGGEVTAEAYGGWFLLAIAVFHALLGREAFQNRELGAGRGLIAFGVLLALLGFALAQWGLASIFGVIGGYVGLVTALLAFWVASVEIGSASEAV